MYEFSELLALTQDREQHTPEFHHTNDFYGHASLLKYYAGLKYDYPLKLVIEHGVYMPGDQGWHAELNAPFPMFFVSSAAGMQVRQKQISDKRVHAIGPLIAYASPIYPPPVLADIKAGLGKNLLVFPHHSTHHIEAHYDEDDLIQQIVSVAKSFDSVTICLYWKDFTQQRFDKYKSNGFYCTSAGHMFDIHFMNRLLTYILLSDAVLCFTPGTACIYSFYCNKHVMALKNKNLYYYDPERLLTELSTTSFPQMIEKYFKDFTSLTSCTQAQYDLLNQCGGFDQVKTKQEIYNLIVEAEEHYSGRELSFLRLPAAKAR